MQFRDKTAYVWGLRYRWDPLLSRNPVPRFPHFMPPCLLLNLDFSAIKITLHCNSFNICCCGTGLAFLLSGSSESSTVKTVKTCFHKKVLSLLVIAVITSSHISISTSFSVNLWHNQYSKLIYVLIYLVHYHFQSFCCHFKKDQTLVESYIHWTLTLRDQNFLTEGTRKV